MRIHFHLSLCTSLGVLRDRFQTGPRMLKFRICIELCCAILDPFCVNSVQWKTAEYCSAVEGGFDR